MKTRNFTLLFVFLLFPVFAYSQVTEAEKHLKTVETDTIVGWKKGIVTGINLAQTALVNWSAGGESSVAFNGMVSTFANYKDTTSEWVNTLDVGFGMLQQGKGRFIKTDDRFDLLSKYGVKAFSNFNYAILANFKTQFAPGYNYPNDSVKISNLLAPAYLLAAVGLNYVPNSYFNAFLAPLTGKLTIVNDDALSAAGAYGVVPGKKTKGEFGGYARLAYSRSDFKGEFLKNIALTSKLDLFSNYLKDPQNIVFNWENLIAMKVNKYISVNINTHLMYDANIRVNGAKAKLQFKEILGVGFFLKL
ncbi:MAG: DUF3078 domain-containing protein [Paludibacter sp.]|nr:DUF3078 domain-containing protein [Paludibacter sp.]